MARFLSVIACGLACMLPTLVEADDIEFAGLITYYGHGGADPEDAILPAPYTGRFEWDPVLRQANIRISAPSLDASLLTDPGNVTGNPLVFTDFYNYNSRPQDEIVSTPGALSVELSSGGINVGVGLIEFFLLDANLTNGKGSWSYSQDCPACSFFGFYGMGGTITSIVGVVPEPSSIVAAIAFCGLILTRRPERMGSNLSV